MHTLHTPLHMEHWTHDHARTNSRTHGLHQSVRLRYLPLGSVDTFSRPLVVIRLQGQERMRTAGAGITGAGKMGQQRHRH